MKRRLYIYQLAFLFMGMSLFVNAQSTKDIAGIYKLKEITLVLNPDNTCLALAENMVLRGVVEINNLK